MRTNTCNVRNSHEDVFENNLRSNTPSCTLRDSDVDTENVDMNDTKNDMNDAFSFVTVLLMNLNIWSMKYQWK